MSLQITLTGVLTLIKVFDRSGHARIFPKLTSNGMSPQFCDGGTIKRTTLCCGSVFCSNQCCSTLTLSARYCLLCHGTELHICPENTNILLR